MLASAASPAVAQEAAPVREGFWISLGFAWGARSTAACCPKCCEGGDATGPSGSLRMGGTLSRRLLVGGEADGYWKRSPITERVAFYSAVLYWYPNPGGTFFVKGGVGLYQYDLTDLNRPVSDWRLVSAMGLAAGFGVGFDVYYGRAFSVTPFLNVATGLTSRATGARPTLLQAGVSAVWH
jgi:hypothetical protein